MVYIAIFGVVSLILLLYAMPWINMEMNRIKNDTKYPYWLRKRL